MDVDTIFRTAGASYKRAEEHLAEAEASLRKLLARFPVAETAEPVRQHVEPEVWGRVEELLAAHRPAMAEKPAPAEKAAPVVS